MVSWREPAMLKLSKSLNDMRQEVAPILAKRRAKAAEAEAAALASGQPAPPPSDLLDVLLAARDEATGKPLSDQELW